MNAGIIGSIVLGTAALGTAVFTGAAITLFNRVIPCQKELRVDMSEMADMATWEEYKKTINPRAEWIRSQSLEHITVSSRDGLTLHGDILHADVEGIF